MDGGKLVRFGDSPHACWSRVDLPSGDPIWISIARTGLVVKVSRLGLFGAKLFAESDLSKLALVCERLAETGGTDTSLPQAMTHPVLRLMTSLGLHSASAAVLGGKLASARLPAPATAGGGYGAPSSDDLDRIISLVGSYAAVLQALRAGETVFPESLLPATKCAIKATILALHRILGSEAGRHAIVQHCDSTTSAFVLSGEFRRQLEVGLALLASFVPDEDAALCGLFDMSAQAAARTSDPDRFLHTVPPQQMERVVEIRHRITLDCEALISELHRHEEPT